MIILNKYRYIIKKLRALVLLILKADNFICLYCNGFRQGKEFMGKYDNKSL